MDFTVVRRLFIYVVRFGAESHRSVFDRTEQPLSIDFNLKVNLVKVNLKVKVKITLQRFKGYIYISI